MGNSDTPRPIVLDWSDPIHWSKAEKKPCRFCGGLTRLRNGRGWNALYAHKVCAERHVTDYPEDLPRWTVGRG